MTVSKAEKAAVVLCAVFLVFFAGRYTGTPGREGCYKISTETHRPAASAAPTRTVFVTDVLLDLNTATLDDLTGLPGVGETRAQAILDYRAHHGPFTRIEDIMNVKGVGEGIFQLLEPYVTVTTPEGGQTP